MNYLIAKCGHAVIAVGSPGSPARKACESSMCDKCLEKQMDEICDTETYLNDDGGANTGQLRNSLPKFTSSIIDREEVRKMIESRDQAISVQAECIQKQREVIGELRNALAKAKGGA